MNEFKIEFKNILKKPLYWLFVCVILLVYTTEVIPQINIYGPKGRNMDFYISSEKVKMEMAYTNAKAIYNCGYVNQTRRFLGFSMGHKEVYLTKEAKRDLRNILEEFNQGKMTYEKYYDKFCKINKKIEGPSFLGITYSYTYLISDKPLNTEKNYNEFRKETNNIMRTMNFSKFTAIYFADIMGTVISMFTVFLIAFVYKKRKINIIPYYFALATNIFLAVCILAGITYFSTVRVANLYSWHTSIMDFFQPLLVWLLPTILYILAEMILLSLVVKNGYVTVVIQYIYNIVALSFDIKLTSFVIRWNNELYTGYMKDLNSYASLIYINRFLYLVLTVVFIFIIKRINKKTDIF